MPWTTDIFRGLSGPRDATRAAPRGQMADVFEDGQVRRRPRTPNAPYAKGNFQFRVMTEWRTCLA